MPRGVRGAPRGLPERKGKGRRDGEISAPKAPKRPEMGFLVPKMNFEILDLDIRYDCYYTLRDFIVHANPRNLGGHHAFLRLKSGAHGISDGAPRFL